MGIYVKAAIGEELDFEKLKKHNRRKMKKK